MWDVIVVGGGPAGLAAAITAARAGASTLVLERAEHPRYKTCGGGLIGPSLAALPAGVSVPVRDEVDRVTFTLDGRRKISRGGDGESIVSMVLREEFDHELWRAVVRAGVEVRARTQARTLAQDGDEVSVRLSDGEELAARVVIGADGSAGFTARYVGVTHDQVDLGLEIELPVEPAHRAQWRGHLLIDWGPIPGSYGWVFPKDDLLTVGVIASRGQGAATKRYLRHFVDRLSLGGIEPVRDSGHLVRCRTDDSPLRRGRVIVAGDAAGLLEPWTREGISFALRSGALAGASAAADDLDGYVTAVTDRLVPTIQAGRRLSRAFAGHPAACHSVLETKPGWRFFRRFCQDETALTAVIDRWPVRAALAALR